MRIKSESYIQTHQAALTRMGYKPVCWGKYFYNQLQTTIHKFWVAWYLMKFCCVLLRRAISHDLSKYSHSEALPLADVIHDNRGNTYGSPAYQTCLDKLAPALQHHYACNSHHPQHYPNGFADMTVIDRIEMIADWLASVRRHDDGDINQSVEINQKRFGYSDADKEWLNLAISAMKD